MKVLGFGATLTRTKEFLVLAGRDVVLKKSGKIGNCSEEIERNSKIVWVLHRQEQRTI